MAYTKNTWVDQDVERPKTYEVTNNQDGSITLTDSFGLVTELGTPVNAVNMNHIEDGIDGCAIRKHNLTETFELGEWVLGGSGDNEGLYKSLISNNIGNAITDTTAWEQVKMGGASGRNVGEIITSSLPLTDAGLHLLDGSRLSGDGIYKGFVDYIADLYYGSSGSSEIRTNPVMTSNTTPYGTASYTGALYSTSQPFAMLARATISTAWTTSNGSITYTFDTTKQPVAGTYRFYFQYGSYDAPGRSLNNVVITVTYEDNTTSTINVGNLTGTIHAIDSYYVTSEFTTSKKIKSFTLSHSGSSINTTTMNIGNLQLQRMVPNYFCQEWEWQTSVTTYGVCGKFVYDSVNNTVRLPKITGIIEGTTDLNALGDLVEAGLPVHTHTRGTMNITGKSSAVEAELGGTGGSGALYTTWSFNGYAGGAKDGRQYVQVNMDASRSWTGSTSNPNYTNSSIQNSSTVQPQTIKAFVYIVVANSTKTSIQVDIDNIATDLNGKANVSADNFNATGTTYLSGLGMPSSRHINLTIGASGTRYTAPANGWFIFSKRGTAAGQWMCADCGAQRQCYTSSSNTAEATIYMAVKKGDVLKLGYNLGGENTFSRFVYAQGSESEA